MQSASIHLARPTDHAGLLPMRLALWPDETGATHHDALAAVLSNPTWAVFVAERDGALCGFLEASIRSCAEGCGPGPAGYIEGWYVYPHCRRQGVGRALVHAAEEWARSRGCRWMASDTEVENTLSQAAHAALGYRPIGSLVHFARPLGEPGAGRGGLPLVLLPETYSVVRLAANDPLPRWAAGPFLSITRTSEELSIVCRAAGVPAEVRQEADWRCLRVAGTLDFALVGVLTSLVNPLAAAGVSVFAVSTFDTDYLLVREGDVDRAIRSLGRAGHRVDAPH